MIERISQVYSGEDLKQSFPAIKIPSKEIRRYNISHLKAAFIISDDQPTLLQKHQWGMISPGSKNGHNTGNLTNARLEQLPAAVSYRIPIRSQRCIIPIDSFYLWEKKNNLRIPYRFFVSETPVLWVAGLWSTWSNGIITKYTFAIISRKISGGQTLPGNRAPLILKENEARLWLDSISLQDVMTIAQESITPKFEGYKISEKINSTNINSAELHERELFVPTLFDGCAH